MQLSLYQVDAFADAVFGGNLAAVCPLEEWLPDPLMQAIAAENNLPETDFFVAQGDGYALRWFTPAAEVDLCGHATLATAHVILSRFDPGRDQVAFETNVSGTLTVRRDGELYVMDFPAWPYQPQQPGPDLAAALGAEPAALYAGPDWMAVFETESQVRALAPDMVALARLDTRGVIATAPGDAVDFVSRFFAPRYGIPEDPVTGSAHCMLTPYWAERLGKTELRARQVSARGGALTCRLAGDRVEIAGRAVLYLEGTIHVPGHV
ncbi:MAG: PhzF family phenazine biosynthesis protein [Inquilinus sp.]|nr:PhzF family phenazine biosynthesis protein [Inquilinus sp.]